MIVGSATKDPGHFMKRVPSGSSAPRIFPHAHGYKQSRICQTQYFMPCCVPYWLNLDPDVFAVSAGGADS